MARIDASINDQTPTGEIAERADVWRIALALLRSADFPEAQPGDVLDLVRYLRDE